MRKSLEHACAKYVSFSTKIKRKPSKYHRKLYKRCFHHIKLYATIVSDHSNIPIYYITKLFYAKQQYVQMSYAAQIWNWYPKKTWSSSLSVVVLSTTSTSRRRLLAVKNARKWLNSASYSNMGLKMRPWRLLRRWCGRKWARDSSRHRLWGLGG